MARRDLRRSSDAYWRQAAGDFDAHYRTGAFVRAFLARRTHLLRQMLCPSPADRLADVGCGSGVQMLLFAPRVAEVIGFDDSAEMIRLAEGSLRRSGVANAQLRQCDAYALAAEAASFDAVISLGLLDYLEDVDRALAEMIRVLKPGGQLVFTTPKHPSLFSPLRWGPGLWLRQRLFTLPPILTVLSRAELGALIARCGLAGSEVRSVWTTMWMVHARKPPEQGSPADE